ncbi:phospholipase D-like protein [Streptomyces brevispora]|uniref:Phospholipase D-like protein n=1 Tax=Streptomyces brevispora TaxID=887462 RepID=A0A561US53_9ACTN|nr:phospholipase D-like protein [Streptomyces brevispora]
MRHPLVTVLALTARAVLAGARSLLAVGEWVADAPPALLERLGTVVDPLYPKRSWPAESTIRRLLARVDTDASPSGGSGTTASGAAAARGVRTHVVVETLAGARGLLSGREPAGAFASVPELRLWHWVRDPATDSYARQHAKLAVADRQVLFLGSANLTESAARRNIEAGVLIRGGDAPQRAAEHIVELQRRGVLQRLET